MPCRLWAYLELIDSIPVVHFRIGFFFTMGQYMQDKLHDFSLNLQAVQNYFVPHLGGLCSEDSSSFKNANYTIVLKFFFFFFFGRCSNPGYVNSYFMNSCKSLKTYDFIHSFPFEVLFMVQQSKFHKLLQNSWGE